MKEPAIPDFERERLIALRKYDLLDTAPEANFDNITSLAASLLETPVSLITLLDRDRNFFKSHFGVTVKESPRNLSFCGHAILNSNEIFIVEDISKDDRFCDNEELVKNKAVFYAGIPLISDDGYPLGTFCVVDTKPRTLTSIQKKAMFSLARQVENLFDLRKKNIQLNEMKDELEERYERLVSFSNVVSHDLKSPLAQITIITRMLREGNEHKMDEDSLMFLDLMEESTLTLKNYINGILSYYKTDKLLEDQKQDIPLKAFFEEIKEILFLNDLDFKYPETGILKKTNKSAFTQIILNLVDNSLKYNQSDDRFVHIDFVEDADYYRFWIEDNGIGIEKDMQGEIFALFKTAGIKDREGNQGTGIGLATVKTLVTKLGGEIFLESEAGKGSTFTFTIHK